MYYVIMYRRINGSVKLNKRVLFQIFKQPATKILNLYVNTYKCNSLHHIHLFHGSFILYDVSTFLAFFELSSSTGTYKNEH